MQLLKSIRPQYVATDFDETSMPANAGKFIKGFRLGGGRNANLNTATGSGAPGGNNSLVLSSIPAAVPACDLPLPEGQNKTVGAGEFPEVNKTFYLNWNSQGRHGIYMIDGDTMQCQIVAIDAELNFSIDPQHYISSHRMHLKVVYVSDEADGRRVKEMYLLFTDGKNWQRYINVIAAIKTNGFDGFVNSYWRTFGPHFDRAEFFDYPVRPPMFCPIIEEVPPVPEDAGKKNNLLDKSVQFAYAYMLTDGRMTPLSPYSLPYFVDQGCEINKTNLVRCLNLKLYAGSALVEKVFIYRRFCDGDFSLFDTINKFSACNENDPAIIGDDYWKRTNPFASYSYDSISNTIVYKYCGDKSCAIVSPEDTTNRFQNDIPITSIAMASAGDAILLANNKYFYDRIDCNSLSNIQLTVTPGAQNQACKPVNRKITLYSWIGRNGESNSFAYRNGPDDKIIKWGGVVLTPIVVDGALAVKVEIDDTEVNLFGLNFGEQEGFLCYLRGTPYYAIGRQYAVDKDGNKTFVGILDMSVQSQKEYAGGILVDGGYFIMQYDFIVPAGKYIATLARHGAEIGSDYQSTSTYIYGIANSMAKSPFSFVLSKNHLTTRNKEIEIDCCANDVDVWRTGSDLFYVFAPRDYRSGLNERWRFIEGYVKETKDSDVGVELLDYFTTEGDPSYWRGGLITDHNGFFFSFVARGDAKKANVQFNGKFNCVHTTNHFRTSGLPSNQRGYFKTNVYVADKNGGEFGKCNRILVRGKVTNCDTGAGISGVAVTISRGQTTYTSTDGSYELIVHNSYEGVRVDRIYMNASGACLMTGCNCECNPVIPYSDNAIPCVNCAERIYPGNPINRQFKVIVSRAKSLKGGARYGIGAVGFDLAGRGTLVSFIGNIDSPTFLERGNFAPSVFGWQLTGPLNLHKDIKYLSFFRTNNLNFSNPLQWVGDKIEFLDINGDVIGSPSGAIRARITIQSLNDYNAANGFSSTTKYQFVDGDRVRIYDDGLGNMFDPEATGGFLDYPILGTNWNDTPVAGQDEPVDDGKSFIIPYDQKLEKLRNKCGFWIELQRPITCQQEESYCEICGTYPIVNGEIAGGITSGVFNTWDTYYQQRFFAIKNCSANTYLHPFESSSITDFFGENCGSCGRKSIKDDTVIQRWYPDDFIKSDEFINEGGYNGIGTFREKNRKQFKGQEGGGIIAVHAERNILFVVGQNDWFVLDYNLNVARVTAEGLLVANLDQNLSDPHQKAGMNYGCAYENTQAIQFFDGMAMWPDVGNRAWVLSNYQQAVNIAEIDNKNWFTDKFKFVADYNKRLAPEDYLSFLYEISAGINREDRELIISFRPRRNMSTDLHSFVNELRETDVTHQETFVFNIDQKKWMRFEGFVPEFYCNVRNSRNGGTLLLFANGRPYYLDTTSSTRFNEFFGIPIQEVIECVYAEDDKKNKWFQGVVVESNNKKFFVDQIITPEQNSFSYIPPAYFKRNENIWYAEVLADMNTYPDGNPEEAYRKMLIDGKRMFGQFSRIRFVGDPERIGEYCELKEIAVRTSASERSAK